MVPIITAVVIAGVLIGTKIIKKRIKLNRKLDYLIKSRDQYDFLLLDIRPKSLYQKGHVPGAVSFPLDEMDYLPVEDMFLTIVVYGKDSKDTHFAEEFLSSNGYFNVISYGSVRHWKGTQEQGPGLHISQIPSSKELLNEAKFDSSRL
jgi:rhodanese-related sulfurtransferase